VLGCVKGTDSESDGAMNGVRSQLLMDARRAMKTRPAGDIVVNIQHSPHMKGFQSIHIKTHHTDMVVKVVLAVESHSIERLQAIHELPVELHLIIVDGTQTFGFDPFKAGLESSYA